MKKDKPHAKNGDGKLVICGAGLFPARDMTAGAISALAACRAVFYQHADYARVKRELQALDSRINLKPFSSGGSGGVYPLWRTLKAGLMAGQDTGFLTCGNPMLRGEGLELSEWCAEEGYRVSVFPGISSLDALLCSPGILAQSLGRGFTVVFAADAASGSWKPDPGATLVIMGATEELDARGFLRLHRALLENLGPGRRVLCARAEDAQDKECVSNCTLAELPGIMKTLPGKTTLLLPYFRDEKENRREERDSKRKTGRHCSRRYSLDGPPSADSGGK